MNANEIICQIGRKRPMPRSEARINHLPGSWGCRSWGASTCPCSWGCPPGVSSRCRNPGRPHRPGSGPGGPPTPHPCLRPWEEDRGGQVFSKWDVSQPMRGLGAADSPVVGLDSIRVSNVLGLIVQPAVRLHRILVRNLSWSVLIPGSTEE